MRLLNLLNRISLDMSECLLRIFLTLCLLLRSFGAGSSADDVDDDVITAARCRIRCLSLLKNMEQSETMSLSRCGENEKCASCMSPCDQPSVSTDLCSKSCTENGADAAMTGCVESCHFLRQVNSIRPGTCPPEMQATGSAAMCVKGCSSDADCNRRLRCCSNGCGWTCQSPSHTFDGMPEIPEAPLIDVESAVDGVTVRWRHVASNTSGPILYQVEGRSILGKRHDEGQVWSAWMQTAQTTDVSLLVERLRPGRWYQFRTSAVNIYGTQGPSLASEPYTLPKEPSRPNPPLNLTEGDTIVNSGIAVSINWSPPIESDLPVARYKIYWSKRVKGQSLALSSSHEFRQVLSTDHLSFQLTDLEPDSTYLIQVQTISQFGDMRLKSDRSSMHITTLPLKKSAEHRLGLLPSDPIVLSRSFVTPTSPTSLYVAAIYYQNGLLRANVTWDVFEDADLDNRAEQFLVQWSPEACATDAEEGVIPSMSSTTHLDNFIIYDLRFDCRYLVRVQPISPQGVVGAVAHTSISTPFCDQVTVLGEVKPDCPRNAPRIPEEPPDLRHSFIITSTNISCQLSWGVPSSNAPITGYQVIWGQVLPSSQYLLMDKSTAVNKILQKEVRVLKIVGLAEATTYIVRVQAISRVGTGRVSTVRFTTPRLQMVPANPLYKEVTLSDIVPRPITKKRYNTNIALASVANVRTQFPVEATTPVFRPSSSADIWYDQLLPRATSSSISHRTAGLAHLLLFLYLSGRVV